MSEQPQPSFFNSEDADDGQHLTQMEQYGERVRHKPCDYAQLSFDTFMKRIYELETMFANVPTPYNLTFNTFMEFYLKINHTLVMMTTDKGTYENDTLTWEDNVAILHQFLMTTLIREELQDDGITQDRANIIRLCLLLQYITSGNNDGDNVDVKNGYHMGQIMDGIDIKYRPLVARLFTIVQPTTRFVFEGPETSNEWSRDIQGIVERNGFPFTIVPYVLQQEAPQQEAPQQEAPQHVDAAGFATPPPTQASIPSAPKKRKINE